MKRLLALLLSLAFLAAHDASAAERKIRVACVGNSVTYGFKLPDRESTCYPACLQRMLGDGYEVGNFGHSGSTLLNRGHMPYVKTPEYTQALEFAADIAVIHLGLNDTDPRNWPNYNDQFVGDYLSLIESFREANPDCRVWICRMTPIFHGHRRFKSGTRDWFWQIQEAIERVARISGAELIDLHENLYCRPDQFRDALHPDPEGAEILARTVYGALTGDYGGLQMPATYTDHMVLQRDVPLRIAGTADAGERVTVRFRGQERRTVTRADGRWEVVLEPLTASAVPARLEVSTSSRRVEYADVLTGDVWLCSGQSNMEFRVNQSVAAEAAAQREYAAAGPDIRLFDMKPHWETNNKEWDTAVLDSLNRLQYYRPTQWERCSAETAGRFSAVGFAFGRMLADSLKVPVGLICNAIGGSPAEAWVDRKTLEFSFDDVLYNWRANDFIQDWVRGRATKNIAQSDNPMQRHPYEPCYLFESGVLPLQRFDIKGVIWYQGESNAHNIEAHERLFPLLVESWRGYWGKELPFYFVQLSSMGRPSWPQFRDSQRRMADEIANSGMAVCSDLGHPTDVHPQRKRAVGERLARVALHRTYGFADVVDSGPAIRRATLRDGAVYAEFDCAEGLHTSDGEPLRRFELAEYDGLFQPAEAVVCEDGTVRICSEAVTCPRFLRYGWQPYTDANMVNGEGLPASTFKVAVE